MDDFNLSRLTDENVRHTSFKDKNNNNNYNNKKSPKTFKNVKRIQTGRECARALAQGVSIHDQIFFCLGLPLKERNASKRLERIYKKRQKILQRGEEEFLLTGLFPLDLPRR